MQPTAAVLIPAVCAREPKRASLIPALLCHLESHWHNLPAPKPQTLWEETNFRPSSNSSALQLDVSRVTNSHRRFIRQTVLTVILYLFKAKTFPLEGTGLVLKLSPHFVRSSTLIITLQHPLTAGNPGQAAVYNVYIYFFFLCMH